MREAARTYAVQMRQEGMTLIHINRDHLLRKRNSKSSNFACDRSRVLARIRERRQELSRFAYRILREALESSPTNVGVIFKEVLKLTDEQQDDLVHLLARTSLGAVIHAAKTVSDRLCFINGLEQILHDKDKRKHLKERTQLHRILVEELWIFGDEYTLGSDDVSLKTVLGNHSTILGLVDLDGQVPKEERPI